jgi:cyclase
MFPAANRRDFVRAVLGGAAGLALPSTSFGQQHPASSASTIPPAKSAITATPLGENVAAFSGAGANVLVVTGPDDVVVINGGRHERSAELLKAIAQQTNGKRVQTLVDADWHPDYSGANETLAKAGTKILAHENTRQYLGADIFVDWQNRTYKALPPQALPTQTFYTGGTMTVGTVRIDYAHLGQAHTDGAIYVFLPGPNVLMAGGALSVGSYPIPDYTTGGWLGGLIAANKTLLGLTNADTRVVPGVGPVQTRADLLSQHDMLAAMLDRFTKLMKQGMGPEDIIAAAPTREFDATWGNPDLFVTAAYRGMWLHVRELGGIV